MSAVAMMLKALANEARLSILYRLHEGSLTWTQLIFQLRMNPKSLRDHLDFLRRSGLVKKREPVGFELTEAGKAFVELSLKDLISTAKEAVEIAKMAT